MTNKKSMFTFKTLTRCEGYYIRKEAWQSICYGYDKLSKSFQDGIKEEYQKKIYDKIMKRKREHILRLRSRADFDNVQYNKEIKEKGGYFNDANMEDDEGDENEIYKKLEVECTERYYRQKKKLHKLFYTYDNMICNFSKLND
jgi:hypothetical protein